MVYHRILNIFLCVVFVCFGCAGSLLLFVWAFSNCSEQGLLFIVVHRLLIVVASLVVEHRFQVHRLQSLQHMGSDVEAQGLQNVGSVIVMQGLVCSEAYGIFLDHKSNPCSLYWEVDSYAGNSRIFLFINSIYKSLHLLTLNSHLDPTPNPSALATTVYFYMSIILFHIQVHMCHILHSAYMW